MGSSEKYFRVLPDSHGIFENPLKSINLEILECGCNVIAAPVHSPWMVFINPNMVLFVFTGFPFYLTGLCISRDISGHTTVHLSLFINLSTLIILLNNNDKCCMSAQTSRYNGKNMK